MVVIYKSEVQIKAVSSMSQVKPTDHLLVLVDEVTYKTKTGGDANGLGLLGYQISYIENHQSNSYSDLVKTIIHEVGHNLGLEHTWEDNIEGNDNDPNNYMSYSNTTNSFSIEQVRSVVSDAQGGRLNKGQNSVKAWYSHGPLNQSTNENSSLNGQKKGESVPLPIYNKK
jgi:hypothetical protein